MNKTMLNEILYYNKVDEVVLYDVTRNKISNFDPMFLDVAIDDKDTDIKNMKLIDGLLYVVIGVKEVKL